MEHSFSLNPFPSTQNIPNIQITGNIARHENLLSITYTLTGDIQFVIIAPPSNNPSRQHELWENTCFEFFIGIKDSPRYWEFNLSPRGDWNIYRFDNYRQGMQEEIAFNILPFTVQQSSDSLMLTLDVNLDEIISKQVIEVAITTVIKNSDGEVSYWALVHKGTQADFHLRDSFIIEL
jgi:hypothetical protein